MLKRLLVAVSATLALTAHAGIPDFLIPGPWSIGITVARWIHERSEKILYVEVVGEGNTLDNARQQGFRLAVEHAVGTVVSSETEVRNSRMVRDEIITYASGYVDRFEIVEQQEYNGRVQVNMKIWVKHSRLANRLLNRSVADGRVEGGRISAQLESLKHERSSGDRLLKSVLADFPARAFDIRLEKTQVFMDNHRNGQLEVSFYLGWNQHYLDSISEAIERINQRSDCGRLPGCVNYAAEITVIKKGFAPNTVAWFDDVNAHNLIQREMVGSGPVIRLAILDSGGNEQYTQCLRAPELDVKGYAPGYYVQLDHNKLAINGQKVKRFNHYVNLSSVPPAELDQVKITIVRASNC